MKSKVIVIVGATGSGKTSLSIEIAKELQGEVISADSRQVYKKLDIGTEKATKEEMLGIPHHLIDVVEPHEVFNVTDFVELGRETIADISSRGKTPIIAGGTGFYVDALLFDQEFPEVPPNDRLRKEFEDMEPDLLFSALEKLDPERAQTIDPNNKRRLIRALEIIAALGKVPEIDEKESPYDILFIGIETDPDTHKAKLATRLHQTIHEKDLLKEVEALRKELSDERMQEFGLEYKIALEHLDKKISIEEMEEKMLSELVKYVKRQKTWFKRNRDIHWFAPDLLDKAEEAAMAFLK